jgi:hypothetical protein
MTIGNVSETFVDFSSIEFNYCVLDEGHVIRNPKTKLSKAIRQISAGNGSHLLLFTERQRSYCVLQLIV